MRSGSTTSGSAALDSVILSLPLLLPLFRLHDGSSLCAVMRIEDKKNSPLAYALCMHAHMYVIVKTEAHERVRVLRPPLQFATASTCPESWQHSHVPRQYVAAAQPPCLRGTGRNYLSRLPLHVM